MQLTLGSANIVVEATPMGIAEPYARERAPVGQVLEPRQCRLAHQIGAAVGCAADAIFKAGSDRNASTSSQSSYPAAIMIIRAIAISEPDGLGHIKYAHAADKLRARCLLFSQADFGTADCLTGFGALPVLCPTEASAIWPPPSRSA